MSIIVVGTNHKFSPMKLREKLSFPKKRLRQALSLLKEDSVFKGTVILSTCNRVELYASTEEATKGITELQNFLCRFHELGKEAVLPYLYIYEDKDAVRHLFSVGCGLDSLILGETQILGQLRSTFMEAREAGFTDNHLNAVFSAAIAFAKKIQWETTISNGKVSIGSIAVDFIKTRLGGLSGKNVVIIGAGKVTELALKCLQDEKPRIVFIANRTFEKAKELAWAIGQSAAHFDRLPQLLKQADVVISATASPHFIIKKEALMGSIPRRLLIIDLAMPRDVEPEVQEVPGVELFNLEDLASIAQENLEKKHLEAERIEELINQEADLLWQTLTVSEPEPALSP
jgi:glutamyl-tRNA reductase